MMGTEEGQSKAMLAVAQKPGLRRRSIFVRLSIIVLALMAAVILPFALFGESVEAAAIGGLEAAIERPTILAIAAILLLTGDVLLPMPSSLVAVLSGSALGFMGGTIVTWLGLCSGSVFGYWIGRQGGRFAMGASKDTLELARTMADRFGPSAIAICRPIPVLAEVSAIYLGISGMPFGRYLAVSCASNLAVSAAYAATGAWAASFDSFIIVFVASVSAPTILWLVWRWLAVHARSGDKVGDEPTAPRDIGHSKR